MYINIYSTCLRNWLIPFKIRVSLDREIWLIRQHVPRSLDIKLCYCFKYLKLFNLSIKLSFFTVIQFDMTASRRNLVSCTLLFFLTKMSHVSKVLQIATLLFYDSYDC